MTSTVRKITIEIELENDAFQGDEPTEVGRILNDYCIMIGKAEELVETSLRDYYGNRVGSVTIE